MDLVDSFNGESSFVGEILPECEVSSVCLMSWEDRVDERTVDFVDVGEDDDSSGEFAAEVGFLEVYRVVVVSCFLVSRLEER